MDSKFTTVKTGFTSSGIWVEPYPVTFPMNEAEGIRFPGSGFGYNGVRLAEEEEQKIRILYIEYINENDFLKSVYLVKWLDFESLKLCKTKLEHISIELSVGSFKNAYEYSGNVNSAHTFKQNPVWIAEYDVEPLYFFEGLKSFSVSEYKEYNYVRKFKLDVSRFPELEKYSGESRFVENLNKATSLKSLELEQYNAENLYELSELKQLDSMKICDSELVSLSGCEDLPKLQCLYLHDLQKLTDISALRHVKHSLKALKIKNCNNLRDFSVLEELENLEFLEINGKNSIPSLSFIKKLKNLRTLIFNVDVQDNDLTPCFDLEYVYCGKRKLSYNHKFKALPKGKYENGVPTGEYIKGNEDIEMWRRFE